VLAAVAQGVGPTPGGQGQQDLQRVWWRLRRRLQSHLTQPPLNLQRARLRKALKLLQGLQPLQRLHLPPAPAPPQP